MPVTKQQERPDSKHRQRPCILCVDKAARIDFKDTYAIKRFLSEDGKIVSRRISGNCAVHQREVSLAIKRSREIGLCG